MKSVKKLIALVVIIVFLLCMPLFLEYFFTAVIAQYSSVTSLSPATWMGFVASYFGFVGSVVLGCIALWQNHKYKEVSDETTDKVLKLLNEIKELEVQVMETNKIIIKLEEYIYKPSIITTKMHFYGISKEDLDYGDNEIKECSFTYVNLPQQDLYNA